MMKWISALLFLVVSQCAFATEPPVSISGPVPAFPTTIYAGFSGTFVYTITNRVPKVLPLTVSGLSAPVARAPVANDCGNHLARGPSTCNVAISIIATTAVTVGAVAESFILDYQGRAPFNESVSFTVAPILSVSGSPIAVFTGGSGNLTITNVSPNTPAMNVTANFAGTALQGNVTITANNCTTLLPGNACTITLKGGNANVAQTNFIVQGSNTEAESAAMSITQLFIGEGFDGGIVGCISGGMNLIAAVFDDTNEPVPWATANTQTSAQSLSNGQANTATITGIFGLSSIYAAADCVNYQVDSEGNTPCATGTCYDSWYLPSLNELECIAGNQNTIGGFTPSTLYWSSTENLVTTSNADAISVSTAPTTPVPTPKATTINVRCISQATIGG
jgi:hypothetical protein